MSASAPNITGLIPRPKKMSGYCSSRGRRTMVGIAIFNCFYIPLYYYYIVKRHYNQYENFHAIWRNSVRRLRHSGKFIHMSTTSSNLTAGAKYQKLINEYSKLRNQVPILKKAVLDEQTKNADLAVDLKFKEQKIRKYDSEIESLTFRNEQLLKRVESLQSMISELQSLSHHNNNLRQSKRFSRNFKLSSSQSDYNVVNNGHATTGIDSWSTATSDADKLQILEEELKRKLLENENLHRKIHEQELKNEQNKQHLTSQIEDLRYELSKCKEIVNAHQYEKNLQNGRKNFTSPKHARSPETSSVDNFGGSICEETSEETRDYDQSSPNCSNYSSITGLSVSKENNQILDLQQQLKEKQQRVADLEKDKERLSLENHLLAVKYGVKRPSATSSSEQQVSSPDDVSRLTEDFYSQKLNESNVRLQEEQSKILYYDNECRNLLTQLETAKRDADQYQSISEELIKSLNNAKDETETMRRNYESQIKALSEHLAQLSQNRQESASKKGFFR